MSEVDYAKCGCGCADDVLSVKPKKGDAVLWYNLKAEGHMHGNLDRSSMHGACDPGPGAIKWGANFWIFNRHEDDWD